MAYKPTVAITGATGFLGSILVEHFSQKDWQVIGLVRTIPSKKKKNVTYRHYDLTGKPGDNLLNGADYLVHTAFIKQGGAEKNAYEANIYAAKQLLHVARNNDLKKALFMSSMSSHNQAVSVYGKQKLAIEKLFSKDNGVSLRSGLILGPGGIVKQMVDFMKSKHAVPLIGGGKQPIQVIDAPTLAQAIENALTLPAKGIYTVASTTVYTYKDFYRAIARQLHIRVLYVPVPFTPLLVILKLISALHIPLDIGADNLLGLKYLRSANTANDLRKLQIQIKPLDVILATPGIIEE